MGAPRAILGRLNHACGGYIAAHCPRDMPNDCFCNLGITGPVEDIRAIRARLAEFAETASKEHYTIEDAVMFSFQAFYPTARCTVDRDECWGTKWEPYGCAGAGDDDDDELRVSFCTAWSPPMPFLAHMALLYPDCMFELDYEEPGAGFAGSARYFDGALEFDEYRECSEYDSDEDGDSDDEDVDDEDVDLPEYASAAIAA
jgi:hypothetical protein